MTNEDKCSQCGRRFNKPKAKPEMPKDTPDDLAKWPWFARDADLVTRWERLKEQWVASYPNINVMRNLGQLHLWCENNPERAARKRNMAQFLTNCLSRNNQSRRVASDVDSAQKKEGLIAKIVKYIGHTYRDPSGSEWEIVDAGLASTAHGYVVPWSKISMDLRRHILGQLEHGDDF